MFIKLIFLLPIGNELQVDGKNEKISTQESKRLQRNIRMIRRQKQKETMAFYRKEKINPLGWLFTDVDTNAGVYGIVLGSTRKCRVTSSAVGTLV